jgi:type I restriction enzyme, S subunit
MSFPRYPIYKASGVEWLGEVPEGWEVDRIKRSILSSKNGVWGAEPQQDESDIPCVRVADFDRQKLRVELSEPTIRNVVESERVGRVLCKGDLLLEKAGGGELQPVGCFVLYDDDRPAVCSNFVARVQVAPDMNASFWRYLHAAAYAVRLNTRSIKQTSGIQNLDSAQYFDERAVFPPLPEQTAIADFLDRETGKIDELVAEQRRLIELLKEKRQAVISHAVTKGLNPHAPMKPSGIEWLGDVPAGWEVLKLKHLTVSIEQGWSPQCEGRPVETDEEWGVLKVGCVNGGVFRPSENKLLPLEMEPIPALGICKGDLLISRANTRELVGSAAVAELDCSNLLLCDKLYRLRFNSERCLPEFVCCYLGSLPVREQIELRATGASASMVNIPQSAILELKIAAPSLREQTAIMAFLETELAKFDTLTAEAQRAIDLLQERRTALISAAVTGKIDVREVPL